MPKRRPEARRLLHGIIFVLIVVASLFVHFSTMLYNWLSAVVMLAIAIYFAGREKPLFGPTLFFLLAFLTSLLPFALTQLGFFYIIPLAIYAIILRIFPSMHKQSRWFYGGKIDNFTWLACLVIAVVSSVALYLWAIITKPDLSDIVALIPNQTLGTLIIVGIAFSVVNSFVEESIYRGILWEAFGKVFGSPIAVILLQSAIFGIAHIQGVPRGAIGVVMAFVYGLLLGWVRHRTKGLLAPILVHFVADIVIYIILIGMMGKL